MGLGGAEAGDAMELGGALELVMGWGWGGLGQVMGWSCWWESAGGVELVMG